MARLYCGQRIASTRGFFVHLLMKQMVVKAVVPGLDQHLGELSPIEMTGLSPPGDVFIVLNRVTLLRDD